MNQEQWHCKKKGCEANAWTNIDSRWECHYCRTIADFNPVVKESLTPAPAFQICIGCGIMNAKYTNLPAGLDGDCDSGCSECGSVSDFLESPEEAIRELAKERNQYRDAYYASEGQRIDVEINAKAPPVSNPLDLEAIEARLKTAAYIGKARSIAEPLIAEIRRLRAAPAPEGDLEVAIRGILREVRRAADGFHNIIGIQWVRLINVPEGGQHCGSVSFYFGPLVAKIFIAWGPRGQREGGT